MGVAWLMPQRPSFLCSLTVRVHSEDETLQAAELRALRLGLSTELLHQIEHESKAGCTT